MAPAGAGRALFFHKGKRVLKTSLENRCAFFPLGIIWAPQWVPDSPSGAIYKEQDWLRRRRNTRAFFYGSQWKKPAPPCTSFGSLLFFPALRFVRQGFALDPRLPRDPLRGAPEPLAALSWTFPAASAGRLPAGRWESFCTPPDPLRTGDTLAALLYLWRRLTANGGGRPSHVSRSSASAIEKSRWSWFSVQPRM